MYNLCGTYIYIGGGTGGAVGTHAPKTFSLLVGAEIVYCLENLIKDYEFSYLCDFQIKKNKQKKLLEFVPRSERLTDLFSDVFRCL